MSSPEPEYSPGSRIAGELPPERAYESWMPDRLSASIVGLALAIGACLRFYRLGGYELTADEAASWYAAAAPTVSYVVRVGFKTNAGKLSLHDLALHFWILAFGDSVISMRVMSVVLGLVAILLIFVLARELLEFDVFSSGLPREDTNRIAALSALIFALSLPAIHYSREARMYSLVLGLAMAQAWFFLRAVRFGRPADLIGAGFLAFLSVAASMIAGAVLIVEWFWLLALLWQDGWKPGSPFLRRALASMASLIPGAAAAGLSILNNPFGMAVISQQSWQRNGVTTFFQAARTAPLSAMCLLTIGLAVWGIIRTWRESRTVIWLTLLWMWLPVVLLACSLRGVAALLLIILSFWIPNFLQRYVLTCLIPFSILIAMGIWRIRPNAIRLAVLALFVGLALARATSYYGSQDEGMGEWGIQWREAAAFAASESDAGRPVAVYPELCEFVVLYYARNCTSVRAFTEGAHLLIVRRDFGGPDNRDLPVLRWAYPRNVARLNGVSVWADR
ncbi:MAG TPA: glycosyltransferase family 39 protein [Candidatus Binataceae bacterium]|nr:glycosyltransferase family 39 protein [Candidatus Binataceae bacterium]